MEGHHQRLPTALCPPPPRQVAAAITASTLLQPQQFALVEHVEVGHWSKGQVLLQLQLEAAATPDPMVNTALPYEYPHPLKGTT